MDKLKSKESDKYGVNKRDRFGVDKWIKGGVLSLIAGLFMSFAIGMVFLIPIAVGTFLVYGLVVYLRGRKNRITVSIKPSAAMEAIARREEELNREKERLLYEESRNEIKH